MKKGSAALLAAEPARAGLSASGYIVARRKATVASEITGKVAEVLIEEGMVVEAGAVLAKLDSVLAEHDLALARSRVAAADAAGTAGKGAGEKKHKRKTYGRKVDIKDQLTLV